MQKLLLTMSLLLLLTACTTSAQWGRYDGVRSAQWASGVPFIGLRFDKARYLTDAEYRDAFDEGLKSARPFTWPMSDGSALVREMLRLDELRAQAEAAAHDKPTP